MAPTLDLKDLELETLLGKIAGRNTLANYWQKEIADYRNFLPLNKKYERQLDINKNYIIEFTIHKDRFDELCYVYIDINLIELSKIFKKSWAPRLSNPFRCILKEVEVSASKVAKNIILSNKYTEAYLSFISGLDDYTKRDIETKWEKENLTNSLREYLLFNLAHIDLSFEGFLNEVRAQFNRNKTKNEASERAILLDIYNFYHNPLLTHSEYFN